MLYMSALDLLARLLSLLYPHSLFQRYSPSMDVSKAELADAIELSPVLDKEYATPTPIKPLRKGPGKIAMPEIPNFSMSHGSSAPNTPGPGAGTPSLGPYTPASSRLSFLLRSDSPPNAQNTISALPSQDTGYAWSYLAAAACIDCASWTPSYSSGILLAKWKIMVRLQAIIRSSLLKMMIF